MAWLQRINSSQTITTWHCRFGREPCFLSVCFIVWVMKRGGRGRDRAWFMIYPYESSQTPYPRTPPSRLSHPASQLPSTIYSTPSPPSPFPFVAPRYSVKQTADRAGIKHLTTEHVTYLDRNNGLKNSKLKLELCYATRRVSVDWLQGLSVSCVGLVLGKVVVLLGGSHRRGRLLSL